MVACDPAGAVVGIAHYRRFALADLAAREGRSVVRWITAADNATAQRLYDDVATRTAWLTYDLAPNQSAVALPGMGT